MASYCINGCCAVFDPKNRVSKRIVITGGSGFVGTNAVDYFADQGYEVFNVDFCAPRNPRAKAQWERVDILNPYALLEVIKAIQPSVVVHLAARADLEGGTIEDYSVNTHGVRNVLDCCRDCPSIDRVVLASSMLVCKLGYIPKNEEDYCPNTAYGKSKVAAEKIIRQANNLPFAWSIVRVTSIWGPWFDVPYRNFFDAIGKGNYFHPQSKRILRSFGYVGNTVYELGKLVAAPREYINGRTLYLGDYPPTDVLRWARLISGEMRAPPVREAPLVLLRIAAVVGDILKKTGLVSNPPLTTFRLNNLLTSAVYDMRFLEELCKELPFSLEEGVRMTVQWLRSEGRR